MTTVLLINSSARSEASVSRQLSAEFIQKWRTAHPDDQFMERDLAAQPLPHLSEGTLAAFFTPVEQRTPEQASAARLSDQAVAELQAADVIVIAAPMYNFSVTSTLKAWIDHVVRAGLTFKYTESGPVGLLQGKKVYVFTSRGGVYSEGPAAALDFHETYLRGVLGFIGLTDITFLHTEGLALGEATAAQAVSRTQQAIARLVA